MNQGGSRMISEGNRFDQIFLLTLRIRTDWPELDPDQTPQNACKTFTETVMYLTKDLESLQELEFTCLFVTTNGKI